MEIFEVDQKFIKLEFEVKLVILKFIGSIVSIVSIEVVTKVTISGSSVVVQMLVQKLGVKIN